MIYYARNFMGWKGPRKMQIFHPKFSEKHNTYMKIQPVSKEETLDQLCNKYFKIIKKNPEIKEVQKEIKGNLLGHFNLAE